MLVAETTCSSQTAPGPRPDDPEASLMLRVQRDEPGAFAELVHQVWPKVFGRFYRDVAVRHEAEDLAQEVFLRLYRARTTYQPRAKFNTWLFHIVQNVARNALRARRRRPTVCLHALAQQEERRLARPLPQAECDSPSRPLERRELAGVVRAAVAELAERPRVALEMHQFHEQSYAEIATQLDMSPKAAKSLLYRARHQLRHQLAAFVE